MNTVRTTTRTRTAAFRIRRLLAVLSLAIALVAIPTFRPTDASARYMWEGQALSACGRAGGSIEYGFVDPSNFNDYSIGCKLPSGGSFTCFSLSFTGGNIVDCF